MQQQYQVIKGISVIVLGFSLLTGCASTGPYAQKVQHNETASGFNVELGLGYLEQGNVERAKLKLFKALAQGPNLVEPYLALAYFMEYTGELEEATHYYQKAIKQHPNSSEAHNNYGVYLCRQGQYTEAERELLLAVDGEIYTDIGKAYENLGLCAVKSNDQQRQEMYFTRAIQQNPNLTESMYQLANLYYLQGQYTLARTQYNQYRRLTSPSARSLWLGIQIETALGDYDARDSYALLLKNSFADSPEYIKWQEFMQS